VKGCLSGHPFFIVSQGVTVRGLKMPIMTGSCLFNFFLKKINKKIYLLFIKIFRITFALEIKTTDYGSR